MKESKKTDLFARYAKTTGSFDYLIYSSCEYVNINVRK